MTTKIHKVVSNDKVNVYSVCLIKYGKLQAISDGCHTSRAKANKRLSVIKLARPNDNYTIRRVRLVTDD